jgi:hypothetical protein
MDDKLLQSQKHNFVTLVGFHCPSSQRHGDNGLFAEPCMGNISQGLNG